jgi:hypothetical protein
MNRPSSRTAFGAAILTAGLMAAAVPAAHAAAIDPGWDNTFVINSCPFPIRYHDATKWFKEIETPGEVQDHFANVSTDFTNLVTGKTWYVTGNVVSHWVPNPDGSLTHTVDGVWPATGPLHTVYYGHWTQAFPDGIPGPVPFVGSGKTVDICDQLS